MSYDSGVTAADVRDEYDTAASDESIERAIRAAEATISSKLDPTEFGDKQLEDIATYLACHYVTGSDPTVRQDSVADSSQTYEGSSGDGLKETRWGRRALDLDHTGGLDTPTNDSSFNSFGV